MEKNKEKKLEVTIVGSGGWTGMRELMMEQLEKCKTEEQFSLIMMGIYLSMGSKEEAIEKRKMMGLDTKDLEELEDDKERRYN